MRRCAPARSPTSSLGALVAVLVGVTVLVLAGNQISEAQERSRDVGARRRRRRCQGAAARRLHPVPGDERTAGGDGAEPRRQPLRLGAGDARTLAWSCPSDVWLTGLTASASPTVSARRRWRRLSAALRAQVPGPALELSGCADRPGGGGRLRHRAQGHRRGDPGRRRILRTGRRGRSRRRDRSRRRHGSTATNAARVNSSPNSPRRRLRRGPGPGRRSEEAEAATTAEPPEAKPPAKTPEEARKANEMKAKSMTRPT